jgi:hypothetical protein
MTEGRELPERASGKGCRTDSFGRKGRGDGGGTIRRDCCLKRLHITKKKERDVELHARSTREVGKRKYLREEVRAARRKSRRCSGSLRG